MQKYKAVEKQTPIPQPPNRKISHDALRKEIETDTLAIAVETLIEMQKIRDWLKHTKDPKLAEFEECIKIQEQYIRDSCHL